MAANKEKVEIKRSDQFQEVDEELTRAMAELDSTIERVSLIFQSDSDVPVSDLDGADAPAEASEGDEGPEAPRSGKKLPRSKDEQ